MENDVPFLIIQFAVHVIHGFVLLNQKLLRNHFLFWKPIYKKLIHKRTYSYEKLAKLRY